MLSRQDRLSILITFTVGLFAGVYLYVAGFATTFVLPEVGTNDVYSEFVLIGEGYGACELDNTCLSFQLLENGSYRALYDAADGSTVVKEGVIPRTLRRELVNALTPEGMVIESDLIARPCQFGDDGTNYRFEITKEGTEYSLDTCRTALDYEGPIWTALAKLWNHLATVEL